MSSLFWTTLYTWTTLQSKTALFNTRSGTWILTCNYLLAHLKSWLINRRSVVKVTHAWGVIWTSVFITFVQYLPLTQSCDYNLTCWVILVNFEWLKTRRTSRGVNVILLSIVLRCHDYPTFPYLWINWGGKECSWGEGEEEELGDWIVSDHFFTSHCLLQSGGHRKYNHEY